MYKKLFATICGLLLSSYVTTSYAIIIEPINPIIYDNNQFSSIEALEANLLSQQQQLQLQLSQINQQLRSVQSFITAQNALSVHWIDANNGQYPKKRITFKIWRKSNGAYLSYTVYA